MIEKVKEENMICDATQKDGALLEIICCKEENVNNVSLLTAKPYNQDDDIESNIGNSVHNESADDNNLSTNLSTFNSDRIASKKRTILSRTAVKSPTNT